MSAPKGYKLEAFSVERLMHFAAVLGYDVVIEIRRRAKSTRRCQIFVLEIWGVCVYQPIS